MDKFYPQQIIHNNRVLEGKLSNPIKTNYPADVALKESSNASRLDYWYDDYLYAFGVQHIMNNADANVPLYRRVFYINKISCQKSFAAGAKNQ